MKKILITGNNSYIGNYIEKRLKEKTDIEVEKISLRNNDWKIKDFSIYDSIVHTAALVHKSGIDIEDYSRINVDLTKELAVKAKEEGVEYFVFMSTMGLYSQKNNFIDANTPIAPKTAYAQSKFEAENVLKLLRNEKFKISILRPPLVYGYEAPGNYERFSKLARITPIIPQFKNQRSMIYVKNLAEFIRLLLETKLEGTFYPQNKKFVNTSDLFKLISNVHGKTCISIPFTSILLTLAIKIHGNFNKVFGDFVYEKTLPGGPEDRKNTVLKNYNIVSFEDSITETEKSTNYN